MSRFRHFGNGRRFKAGSGRRASFTTNNPSPSFKSGAPHLREPHQYGDRRLIICDRSSHYWLVNATSTRTEWNEVFGSHRALSSPLGVVVKIAVRSLKTSVFELESLYHTGNVRCSIRQVGTAGWKLEFQVFTHIRRNSRATISVTHNLT